MTTEKTNFARIEQLVKTLVPHETPLPVGARVVWKDGLKNKIYPEYGEVVIITRSLAQPIANNERNAGSCYFNEPLDIAIAKLDSDGDLVEHHFDSRRFRLATEEEIALAMG